MAYRNDDSGIEVYTGSSGAVVRRNVQLRQRRPRHRHLQRRRRDRRVEHRGGQPRLRPERRGHLHRGDAARQHRGRQRRQHAAQQGRHPRRQDGRSPAPPSTATWCSSPREPTRCTSGTACTYTSLAAAPGRHRTGGGTVARRGTRVRLAPGRDLALTAASPAIDAADSGVPGWAAADLAGHDPVDQPDRADTGTGPVTYADLGALERTTVTVVDQAPQAALSAPHLCDDRRPRDPGRERVDRRPRHHRLRVQVRHHGRAGHPDHGDLPPAATRPPAPSTRASRSADAAGHTATATTVGHRRRGRRPRPHRRPHRLPVDRPAGREGDARRQRIGRRQPEGADDEVHLRLRPGHRLRPGPRRRLAAPTGAPGASPPPCGSPTAWGRTATATPHGHRPRAPAAPRGCRCPTRRRAGARPSGPNASRSHGDAVSTVTAWKFRVRPRHGHPLVDPHHEELHLPTTGRKTIRVWVRNDLGLVATAYRVVRVHR